MRRLKKNFVCRCRGILVRMEDKLEQKASQSSSQSSGWWIAAQRLRKQQSIILDRIEPAANRWTHETIELDTRRREIVQRETYILEKVRQARHPTDKVDNEYPQQKENHQALNEWLEELKTLNQDYWAAERRIYIHNNHCPSRPFKRAYISTQKKPQWYLSPWLCEDCAERGGCCGRACGCCQKPRSDFRLNGHGHCTKFCDCCIRARGFELDEAQTKLFQHVLNLLSKPIDRYSARMFYAYIYGFVHF